ncbi:hypothetical protein ILUMI_23324 [Ignelater luminosus]|uniref:Protein GUCD1 n=1 Tax=Ignelater luminosus TaxID=2038154 RepID=A0A8K0CCL7_IGNLU|nr:hypothetical protein ILUMI_23324 [Ignelater luminosus]
MDNLEVKLKQGQPEKILIQLKHYKQKYNWDCGVSCVLMVLPNKSRQILLKNFFHICKEEGFNKSTWTIDLCYLLRRYNIEHEFYTVTLGVHPGYRGNSFYNNILDKDEERIRNKFNEAKANGVNVREASVSISFLIEHLTQGPAILLTNARLLTCDICKLNKLSVELRKCLPWPSTSYQGHYIVLCGYDINNRKVYYRNPSLQDRVCMMPVETLEEARKSFGTDQDLILIYS